MALTAIVRQQQRRSDLADFRRRHNDTCCLRLDLKEFLDGRDNGDKVRIVHTLQYLRYIDREEFRLMSDSF